jgi:hypothetical protein
MNPQEQILNNNYLCFRSSYSKLSIDELPIPHWNPDNLLAFRAENWPNVYEK